MALCGVSVRHFARLHGGAAASRISEVQIGRAARMLRETSLPMKVIGARLGFAHPGSFSSAFRRSTGVTPTQYRQSHGATR